MKILCESECFICKKVETVEAVGDNKTLPKNWREVEIQFYNRSNGYRVSCADESVWYEAVCSDCVPVKKDTSPKWLRLFGKG